MIEYLLTYLWTGMECFAAILLFDGFSERKCRPSIHWLIAACLTVLDATVLNLLDPGVASFTRTMYGCAVFFILHRILYQSDILFGLCIAIIYYATMSCVDNLCSTFVFFLSGASTAIDLSDNVQVSVIIHIIEISLFYLHNRIRKSKVVGTTSWKWYTVPTLFSFLEIAFRKDKCPQGHSLSVRASSLSCKRRQCSWSAGWNRMHTIGKKLSACRQRHRHSRRVLKR